MAVPEMVKMTVSKVFYDTFMHCKGKSLQDLPSRFFRRIRPVSGRDNFSDSVM
jgi:hypothetical protein